MKKSPYILVLAAALFFAFAHAAPVYACDPAATGGNDGCTATQYCDESTLVCKDLSSAPSNTGANGSAAGQNTATPSATSNTSAATTPGATTQTASGTTDPGQFVPLTSLPAIQGLSDTSDLSSFFNQLYKICIGVAAALAFLQIIRAGIMYMGGDSVTETKQARAMIGTSILGLVLVLSPAIVFGIINPNILSLKVGFSALAPAAPTGVLQANSTAGDGTCSFDCAAGNICSKGACVAAPTGSCTPIASGATISGTAQETCCQSQKNSSGASCHAVMGAALTETCSCN